MQSRKWVSIIAVVGLVTWFNLAGVAEAKKGKGGGSKKSVGTALEVGKAAPSFELSGSDGKTHRLADYKNKIVVIEWINKDCPVSHGLLGKMKETAHKLSAKGVVWLAIDSTAAHAAADNVEYVKSEKIPYTILGDFDGTIGHKYHAMTTPHMYVINKGVLAYQGAIDNKSGRNYVVEAVDALLAGKPVPVSQTQPYGCGVKYKH